MDDIKDRLARAEQDIKNHKENFTNFKADDFGALKREVHAMRGEINVKMDALLEKVGAINIQLAKWVGAGGVLVFLADIAVRKFIG